MTTSDNSCVCSTAGWGSRFCRKMTSNRTFAWTRDRHSSDSSGTGPCLVRRWSVSAASWHCPSHLAAMAARHVGSGRPSRTVVDPNRLEIAMRSFYAGLGFVLLLSLPAAASAQQRALTITRPSPADTVRSVPDADETIQRYRRTSSQRELIFRRAARAAAQREARIEWRRRTGHSASRPNMVLNRRPTHWYGGWRISYSVTYYTRVR